MEALDISLLFAPIGVSTPKPDELRQVLYAASDAVVLNRPVDSTRDAFDIMLLSSSQEHQRVWSAPNESRGKAQQLQQQQPWTILSEAKFVQSAHTRVRFRNNAGELFDTVPGLDDNPLRQVDLYPFLPPVPLMTEAELKTTANPLHPFAESLTEEQKRLSQFKLQVVWESQGKETTYEGNFLNAVVRLKRVGTNPSVVVTFGPVQEVDVAQRQALGFPCFWMQLRLTKRKNENNNLNDRLLFTDPQFQIAHRFEFTNRLPEIVTNVEGLNALVEGQSKLILNRQRDVSERAFWMSQQQQQQSSFIAPIQLIPLCYPTVPRLENPVLIPYSYYQDTLRRMVTRMFLMHFTSDIIPLLKSVRLADIHNVETPDQEIALTWIRPHSILAPTTRLNTFLPMYGSAVLTPSVLTYTLTHALLFIQARQVPHINRAAFVKAYNQALSNEEDEKEDLKQIFLDVNHSWVSQSTIPRRSFMPNEMAHDPMFFEKQYYLAATFIPWYQTNTQWNRLPYAWQRASGELVIDGPNELNSPVLLTLMHHAWQLLRQVALNPQLEENSNVLTALNEVTDFNWFNSVSYEFENNLYWEANDLYNLVLQKEL